eukprot:CAMPEP_0114482408 /NCGR_PEP_ID=MMETSP0104-20121206/18244_1 /TAXON_ID=37642 ORGANISM="Paraphysomonas imperforata, Strain PA2" /NCGR_SAMPLE_ID=MMETSP0104 /ASSEMBLY_ACC=CAM_ASM_000202 /LENGTH=316 /DNA_ID=CAMNT_0001658147 /DNA_START=321 /DNA_END=1271 /DNA_ORIENTATION=+
MTRTTSVEVSVEFETLFQGEPSPPRSRGVIIKKTSPTVDVEDFDCEESTQERAKKGKPSDAAERFPWVSLLTKSRCQLWKLTRSGLRHRIVVVPGDSMLAALIRAREALGPPPDIPHSSSSQLMVDDNPVVVNDELLPYCYELVQAAVLLFFPPGLPNGWTIGPSRQEYSSTSGESPSSSGRPGMNYQVVLEDFCASAGNHAAAGRLSKALSPIDELRIASSSQGGRGPRDYAEPSTLQLKKNGDHFSVLACKDVRVMIPKLLPMLVLYINSECDSCTVIQTRNRKDTTNWIEKFCQACQEESLLFILLEEFDHFV